MEGDKVYLLSIDLGTQGVKTALLDPEGNTVCAGFRENRFVTEEEGEIAISPDFMLRAVAESTRKVLETSAVDPARIACIGVVGMMAGIVGIDRDWNPVTRYDTGLDKRCEGAISQMQAMAEDEVMRICGAPIIDAMGAKMYWWKQERREIFEKVQKFVPASTYVCGAMAGLCADQAYIDYTHIHWTCLADVEKCEWSHDLLRLFGYPAEKLPRIISPYEVIGSVSRAWADRSGLIQGTPIIAGCGDTAASSLGAGLVKNNMALDIAGTASCMSVCVDSYRPDVEKKILIFPRSVIPGLWTPFGFVLGGQTMSWYQEQVSYDGGLSFQNLSEETAKADKADLFFIPYFAGRICPSNSGFSGNWVGMKFYHNRADMFKSIMESIAYEYRFYLNRIHELFPQIEISEIITSAGGARSRELIQTKADVLKIPFVALAQRDTSHKASAIMAGYGVGLYSDMAEQALSMCRSCYGEKTAPNLQRKQKYDASYRKYLNIVDYLGNMYAQVKI